MKRTILTSLGLVLLSATVSFAQQAPPANPPTPTQSQTSIGPNFVDANGDGICDLQGSNAGQKRGRGYGPGDGTGNQGMGPKDGTGYGAKRGAGTCTGTCTGQGQGQGRGYRGGRG